MTYTVEHVTELHCPTCGYTQHANPGDTCPDESTGHGRVTLKAPDPEVHRVKVRRITERPDGSPIVEWGAVTDGHPTRAKAFTAALKLGDDPELKAAIKSEGKENQ